MPIFKKIRSMQIWRTKENYLPVWVKQILYGMMFCLIPILLFYLMESYEHNAWKEVRFLAQIYNILLFEGIAWSLFFLTGKGTTALRIEIVAACLYGIINHYIMEFRSTPFVPWDIFSIKTAASVAGNYDFTPSKEMLVTTGGFLFLFFVVGFLPLRFALRRCFRVGFGIGSFFLLGIFVTLLQDDTFQSESSLYPFLFTPSYMTKVNGMAVTFAMNLEYVYVERPSGYSIEKAQQILEAYEASSIEETTTLPNVIVIMNEAFSDVSVLGDFTTNEDYMPFLHQLQNGYKNTVTGNLTVSVCGGNTANSEFEFLTGHTMDFFPIGSIPYQQYIKQEIPSLVSQLAKLGYDTYGVHPYSETGWNRNTVYPNLGFSHSLFLSDFTKRKYIRNYVSDETAYDKIIELYEKKEANIPLFVFEVTMQNHSGYTEIYENFTPDIEVEEWNHTALNQYLSLLKVSDTQLQRLIAYFEKEEEDTILVFFGDHQPSDYVVNPILRANGADNSNSSQEDAQLRYIVPYVIWANFEIAEETGADMDISYLGANVLKRANLPTDAYQNFLLEMQQEIEKAEKSKDSETLSQVEQKYRQMYQILQYYFMFDV